MTRAVDLLGPRHAARILGVHENTIRNWVHQGLLTDLRIPGTRFIKIDPEEVERLRASRPEPLAGAPRTVRTNLRVGDVDVFITVSVVPVEGP